MTYFFKNLYCQNHFKEAVNIGGGQIKGALFNFFLMKKYPFFVFSGKFSFGHISVKRAQNGPKRRLMFLSIKRLKSPFNMFL